MSGRSPIFNRKQSGGNFVYDDLKEHPGDIFYVDSGHSAASDTAGFGKDPDSPFATIDYAIGQCAANNGDVIYVAPGHAETVSAASGIDVDVAGISIVGLGRGTLKPTVTLGTVTTATVVLDAANARVEGLRFVSNIDSLAAVLDVNAGDYSEVVNCDFVSSSAKEYLAGIDIANNISDFRVSGCRFIQPTDPGGSDAAAGTGAIYVVGGSRLMVEDCEFWGNFETALLHNKTTAATDLWIKNCRGTQKLAGAEATLLVSTTTGGVERCAFGIEGSADVAEANTIGTLGALFFNYETYVGNDGGGGQLAVAGSSAAT